VAFSNTALPEVIGDGGALVADGDVASMADECAALIDEPTRFQLLSERGVKRAKAFDWSTAARRYAELYAMAATGRRT